MDLTAAEASLADAIQTARETRRTLLVEQPIGVSISMALIVFSACITRIPRVLDTNLA